MEALKIINSEKMPLEGTLKLGKVPRIPSGCDQSTAPVMFGGSGCLTHRFHYLLGFGSWNACKCRGMTENGFGALCPHIQIL